VLIGYGRVSTIDQDTRSQRDQLEEAGCGIVFEETASGGDRSRPELAKALARVRPNDTLVVVRIDRLARSLSHLLEIIDNIRRRKAHFRSLSDPIDTSSPQGLFTLQVLGAAAEFERALIRERTKAGLLTARANGRVGGNPGLKAKNPDALAKLSRARRLAEFERLEESSHLWLPTVERLRPLSPWTIVTGAVQHAHPAGGWTREKLVRAVRKMVGANRTSSEVLAPAPRLPRSTKRSDVARTIGMFLADAPGLTLEELKRRLDHHRIRPPSMAAEWSISTLGRVVEKARRDGIAPQKYKKERL
jgi:DNA invertase Pin-like site-specific DNA recombinase